MGIALSPNGQYAYVIDQMNKALYTVNVGTDTISNTLSGIWSDPLGVALSPDGSYAYVANSAGSNGLYVVDLNSDVVVNSIATIGASQVAVYS
jgi:DNA-binding beta-propeller fold protein YncE